MVDESDTTPLDRATTALEECITTLEAAEEASVTERIRREQTVIEELADTLADCYADGLTIQQPRFAAAIADVSRLTKTEAKSLIARKVQEASTDDAPLNVWIADNLDEVRVIRTTDHIQDTRYVWDFDSVMVETASGDGRRGHFSWTNFRDLIYESGGPYLDKPDPDYRSGDDWREFIVTQEEAQGVEKKSTGFRTQAVNYLQDRVRTADGFGTLEAAADYQGCYVEVNNDPPDGKQPIDDEAPEQERPQVRVDLLMVPNEWAKDAAEEFDITTRALQNELDARDYTLDGQTSVSSNEDVGDRYETFWTLSGDFAAPAAYQPDSVDASDPDTPESEEQATKDTDTGSVGGGRK